MWCPRVANAVSDITLLRLRALLTRAHGDDVAYWNLVNHYASDLEAVAECARDLRVGARIVAHAAVHMYRLRRPKQLGTHARVSSSAGDKGIAMGRHSASHIAARHRHSTEPTAAGAATYVRRVGSFALALGIGAAVAGGAGIANAKGPTDNTDGPAAQSSPDSSVDGTAEGPADTETLTAASPGVSPRKPGLFNAPKMRRGNLGSGPNRDQDAAGNGRGSLPGLIADVPRNIAAALVPHASTAASGSPSSQAGDRPAPRIRSRAAATPPAAPTRAGPTASDDADVHPVVRHIADAATAAVRDDVQPRHPTLAPAASTIERKGPPSPSTTIAVPTSAGNFPPAVRHAPTQSTAAPTNPVATVVSGVLSALGISPSASSTGDSPIAPMPLVQGVLQLLRREIENMSLIQASPTPALTNANPAVAPWVPAPADEAPTVYGDIGKWMLEFNGQISDYGGQPYGGRTLLEPVNVIIVDPTSKTPVQASRKLQAAMFWSGFPPQPIHSTGFRGTIDDVTYRQRPRGLFLGYSNNLFVFPNDHGRIFGPDPAETSTGFVWSGAFSTEQLGLYRGLPSHTYVSSNMARTALAMGLIFSGQATYGGMVPLDNSVDTVTTTTGDHDGYAVILVLT